MVFGALVVATLVLAPIEAFAQRGGGGGGFGGGGRGGGGGGRGGGGGAGRIISAPTSITGPGPIQVGPTPFPQSHRGSFRGGHGFHGHHHHRFGHKGFIGTAPVFWWGGAPYYYPYYAQAYYDTAATYVYAPPAYSAPEYAPAPPMQRVVEYPTGRYELRGDGYSTPYHWIWIPNAPAAPPAPAEPPPTTPPASTTPEPPGKTTVYRWTDANGVTHYTDRADRVPAQYRTPVRNGRSS